MTESASNPPLLPHRRLPFVVAFSIVAGTVSWAFVLAGGRGFYAASSGALLGAGLVVMATASVVGVLVVGGRWALRLSWAVGAVMLACLTVSPVSPGWWVGTVFTTVAVIGLLGDGMRSLVRRRPPVGGPPPTAVLLILGALTAPVLIGAASPDGVGGGALAVTALFLLIGGLYAKAVPGSLWALRLGTPATGLLALLVMPLPSAAVGLVLAGALTVGAWTTDARVAVMPLAKNATTVRIPPELAPSDVLDAAGLDDRGRKRPR